MVYGDEPLSLNAYTYMPDVAAITQSGNLYVYGLNNPVMYRDPSGEAAAAILKGAWAIGGGAALADGPLPVGDVIGLTIGISGTIIAGGIAAWNALFKKPETSQTSAISIGGSTPANPNPNGNKKPSLKKVDKKEADRIAKENGYKNAEDMKTQELGKGSSGKYNISVDTSTGDIYFTPVQGTGSAIPFGG